MHIAQESLHELISLAYLRVLQLNMSEQHKNLNP